MTTGRRRPGRAAVLLIGMTCMAGLTACHGSGSATQAAPPTGAPLPAATSTGTKAGANSPSSATNTQPCDLLTQAMAGQVLGKNAPAPDMNGPTMCDYALTGPDYGNSVAFAVEKWQDGRTVQDEVQDLDIVGSDGTRTQHPVSDLGPDALIVADNSTITVVWKAGDVQKISVSTTGDRNGTRDRLLKVARQIFKTEQGQ